MIYCIELLSGTCDEDSESILVGYVASREVADKLCSELNDQGKTLDKYCSDFYEVQKKLIREYHSQPDAFELIHQTSPELDMWGCIDKEMKVWKLERMEEFHPIIKGLLENHNDYIDSYFSVREVPEITLNPEE